MLSERPLGLFLRNIWGINLCSKICTLNEKWFANNILLLVYLLFYIIKMSKSSLLWRLATYITIKEFTGLFIQWEVQKKKKIFQHVISFKCNDCYLYDHVFDSKLKMITFHTSAQPILQSCEGNINGMTSGEGQILLIKMCMRRAQLKHTEGCSW